MITNTEIIGNKVVSSVEQLAGFLKPGDIFRKAHGNTKYKFDESKFKERVVICENLDTQEPEEIYFSSPVFKLTLG